MEDLETKILFPPMLIELQAKLKEHTTQSCIVVLKKKFQNLKMCNLIWELYVLFFHPIAFVLISDEHI